MLVLADRRVFALSDASGSKRVPQVVSAELLESGEAPLGAGGVAQRLLVGAPSPVLDGDAFVDAASALPRERLSACLENCLLECTNTRAPGPEENSSYASSKLNVGLAALVQHAAAASGGAPGAALGLAPGGSGSGAHGSSEGPALFPASAGLPSLGTLLHAAVLPPSATSCLISPPAAHLFGAHSPAGAGRRSAAESFEVGSVPVLQPRGRSHVRSAACRGNRVYCLLSGVPVWHHFDLSPPVVEADAQLAAQQQGQRAAQDTPKSKGKQPRRQQQHKRKHEAVATGGAVAGIGTQPPSRPRRQPLAPRTLRRSACSCSPPDLGVLWCVHRCDGMAGLLSDPGLHVLDCDALEALLAPLGPRQLAQLLLTVAFAGGTLPDVVLSLRLAPAAQAALFRRRLGSLPLPLPLTADLRLCCYSPADAALASYTASVGPDPYSHAHPARDGAVITANPLQPAHTAMRLSVLSTAKGSALRAVDARVRPLTPELVWHLKGMGVDALDLYPETLGQPNAAGVWPAEVRGGAALGFEDALSLARALSTLGGGYASVALHLLKDLTTTAAHPQYCLVTLPFNMRASFARRLAQLWQQLTTPEQRWHLFLEGGMRLPAVWSEVLVEVAWQAVGQYPVLWALSRHLGAAKRGTTRAAAMALLTKGSSLLPRSVPGAGASAFADLLLFERTMQRGFMQHADGLTRFLAQKRGQLRPAREGSLLQRAARTVAQQLLDGQSLAQSHAAFQELILDLQEAVLAEAAALLQDSALSDVPAPGTQQAEPPALPVLPGALRSVGAVLRSHTVGVLNSGLAVNAEGLDRHALPAHLPPALASAPFNWVTLDLHAMLAPGPVCSTAACWAAAYLQLAPKYSPAGSVSLWAWLRQGGTLSLLLGCAITAAVRRDWHVAAMLADSAVKYLNNSVSLAPSAVATELALLQAVRPLLRTLAVAAAAQLKSCLVLLGAAGSGGADGGQAMLTHTSSLRACCLLLRAVLALMAEALEPLLLQPRAGAVPPGLPPHLLQLMHLDAPPGVELLLHAQQAALQQAHAALQQAAQDVADVVQAANAAVQAAQDVANVAMQAAQPLAEQPPPQQQQPQEQAQQAEDGQAGQAAAAQPPGAPSPAAAAAAVAAGQPLPQPLPPAVFEGLAADASVLLQVAEVAMELSHATLCAVPLLPLASHVPAAAAGSARHRVQQDTALWRAAELVPTLEQYPYHHDLGEDAPQNRAFALNEAMLLLSQALLVALLPLLGRPPAQQGASPPAEAAGPSRQPPSGRGQASRRGGGAEAAGQARQRGQQRAAGLEPGAEALEGALLSLLPLADRLGSRLMEMAEEGDGRLGSSASATARMKHAAACSLLCCVLHLATGAGGAAGAGQVAALPSAWKLLSSFMLDVSVIATDRMTSSYTLRLTHLAPSTLLRMLRACTVVPAAAAGGPGSPAAPAAAAALAGGPEQQQHGQVGREQGQQAPAGKRRRRSARLGQAAAAAAEAPLSGSAARAGASPDGDAGRAAGGQAAPAAGSAPAARCDQGRGTLRVGCVQLHASLVQAAASRVLTWLTTGIQENWRVSSYSLWRPRGMGPSEPGAVAPGPAVAAAAAAAAAAVAAAAAAADDLAQAAALPQQQQAGVAAGQHALGGGGAQPAAPAAPAAEPAGLAALARPSRAFMARQLPGSLVAAAFSSHWPAAAVEVLHWWLRHRAALQPPEMLVGASTSAVAPKGPPLPDAGLASRDGVFQLLGVEGASSSQADSRREAFATLDGAVRLASQERSSPQTRMLCSTLLTLLCMECAPDVHAGATSALLSAARLPGAATELVDCAPFWVLQRLLARGDGPAALPAQLAASGRQVVAAVESALLAKSGDWAAVLGCQASVAADAEALVGERRAAAAANAAAAAGGPQLDAAGNLLLPPQPPWFNNNPPFDPLDPYHLGMMGVHGMPVMAAPFDEFEDEEEEDEFGEDDEMFDEDGDEDEGFDSDADMDEGDPWLF